MVSAADPHARLRAALASMQRQEYGASYSVRPDDLATLLAERDALAAALLDAVALMPADRYDLLRDETHAVINKPWAVSKP